MTTVHGAPQIIEALAASIDAAPLPDSVEVQFRHADLTLTVYTGERRTDVSYTALASWLIRNSRNPSDTTALRTAFLSWLNRRPVSNAEAATTGLVTLAWSDERATALGWNVVVVRNGIVVPWLPQPEADPETVMYIRHDATIRSLDTHIDTTIVSEAIVYRHATVPLLAAAALINPERVHNDLHRHGLDVEDPYVVISPGNPIAITTHGIANRLAIQPSEPHVIVPLDRMYSVGWIHQQ